MKPNKKIFDNMKKILLMAILASLLFVPCKGNETSIIMTNQLGIKLSMLEEVKEEKRDLSDDFEEQKKWLDQHKEEAIANYLEKAGNVLDPDELRKSFTPIGYTGSNVEKFKAIEKILREEVFDRMLSAAIANGNPTITFLTGVPGAGKSTATREMDFSSQAIVFDSALNSFSHLEKPIKKAIAKGIKPKDITVIAVYNDPKTAFSNTIERGLRTGRWVGIDYFAIDAFVQNYGKIDALCTTYPEITIKAIDNSFNKKKEASLEEALNWDYNLTIEQITELLLIIYNGHEQNRLNEAQVSAILGGFATDTKLTIERVYEIATAIEGRIAESTGRVLRKN